MSPALRSDGQFPPLEVRRLPVTFESDVRRVITRFFDPGGETRVQHIVGQVAQLTDAEVDRILAGVLADFGSRHQNVEAMFEENFGHGLTLLPVENRPSSLPENRRLLIGSYLTMEYSVESAALFNPSIVPHRNQRNLPEGAVRFILSLRATGEGHVSSIVFREGVIEADHTVRVNPPARFTSRVRVVPDWLYEKPLFRRKLKDIGVYEDAIDLVLGRLGDYFTISELEHALAAARQEVPEKLQMEETVESIRWLARANYQLEMSRTAEASEIVIFPQSSSESRGIEDLRMVRFVEDDGSVTYYGTSVAFDGYHTLPQLIETQDFLKLRVHTLNGARAQNKGMALFPRRIHGHYAMCSRIDGENLYIMYSDIIHFWETAEMLQTPHEPWELVQVGNCGSPLETPRGWLLLTHGVGPVRTYCIGAMLLDLQDPLKVIGRLREPLIVPTHEERDGYVPNVVYTCGAMIHNDSLYVPFATSDRVARFAYVPLAPLLDRLVHSG
jgi:predicted GH43/DUF377 family glycosyl hydrolase